MSLHEDRLSAHHLDPSAVTSDRAWTYNPANSYDLSTPLGAHDYFRMRDKEIRGSLASRNETGRRVTTLQKIFFALVFGCILAVGLS
jgi:hypothetical protein